MTLYLLDGHALAYRAYYALAKSPLTNSRGESTGAVFGFLRMLLQLRKRHEPTHLAVAFDAGGETERHRLFPAYKANRKKMPDDMRSQLPVIERLLEAMRIPVLAERGYEADDIIATATARAREQGMEVRIVTGDKDLMQLLSPDVRIIRPSKGTGLEDEIGPEYCDERYGLEPPRIVDLLALMGDSSDNVPGVRGIGKKTALRLLHEFGTLDAILERSSEISPAHVRRKIEEGREQALLSRRLVTLAEAPVEIDLEGFHVGEPDENELADLLMDLEFHGIVKELGLVTGGGGESSYRLVGRYDLDALAAELRRAGRFAVDTETTSLHAVTAELVGISFATEPGKAWYLPVAAADDAAGGGLFGDRENGVTLAEARAAVGPLLADPGLCKIGHNCKYDILVLENAGMTVAGELFDTMVASYVLEPEKRSHSLDTLALELLRHRMIPYAELFDRKDRVKDIRGVPLERMRDYACEDADYTFRLWERFEDELDDGWSRRLFREIEMPLVEVLARMEREGMGIDTSVLAALEQEAAKEIETLTVRIHELAGETFNINSGKQLQEILFGRLGLTPVRKTKTGFSTDSEVLTELAGEHPIASSILEYRQLVKLSGTYIEALPRLVDEETGRIHTSFNQAVASTGRLSSSNPNLQNIPVRTPLGRSIRKAFVPRSGNVLLDADYSQIELRIMAHLSGDEELLRAFRDGADVHRRTAARIHDVDEEAVTREMRARAKTINFGVMYGLGARGLARQLDIPVEEAKRFIDDYFSSHEGIAAWIEAARESARERGWAETLLGRRRALPDIDSSDGRMRAFSERIAVNMPIQGTAADMIKVAMIRLDRHIRDEGLAGRMVLQVHDELVFDVPREELEPLEEAVRRIMSSALELDIPVVVETGKGANWLEAHP